jgi:hypothetical protein
VKHITYFFVICLGLFGCAAKSSNELEDISKDVLKAKQGVEIKVFPLPKDSPQSRMNPRGD